MWQDFLQQIQQWSWVHDAEPWFQSARSAWSGLNSLLLVGGLFWISQRLKSERRKFAALVAELAGELNDKIAITTEIAKAARNSAETAALHAQSSTPAMPDHHHWANLHNNWQRVRERIDKTVNKIQHPIQRRKYAQLGRESYHDLINALKTDGHIPAHAASALLTLNAAMLSHKDKTAPATSDDVAHLQSLLETAEASLPAHTDNSELHTDTGGAT